MNDILWVIGIVDSYGHVESVIIRHDDPRINTWHETLFGLHGTRWRAQNIDNVACFKQMTDEEHMRVKEHLENIFGVLVQREDT